jgi:hypothetical protein
MRRGGFHDALENLRYFKYRTIADVRNASAKFVEPMDYLQRPLTPSRTNLNDWRGNMFARLGYTCKVICQDRGRLNFRVSRFQKAVATVRVGRWQLLIGPNVLQWKASPAK